MFFYVKLNQNKIQLKTNIKKKLLSKVNFTQK